MRVHGGRPPFGRQGGPTGGALVGRDGNIGGGGGGDPLAAGTHGEG